MNLKNLPGAKSLATYSVVTVLSAMLSILLLTTTKVHAQQFNGSAYSAYGLGDRVPQATGLSSMLGGAGIALSDSMHINTLNPASYTSVYSRITQITNFSIDWTQGTWREDNNKFENSEISFLGFGLWFRLNRKFGMNMGLTPYTKVDYNISKTTTPNGTAGNYEVNYKGTGGISRAYLGLGFRVTNNLSVGAHANYYFGSLMHNQYLTSFSNSFAYYIKNTYALHALAFDYGFQYTIRTGKSSFTLGGTYQPETKLRGNSTSLVYSATDTLDTQENTPSGYFIPQKGAGGISWTYDKKVTVTFDATYEMWNGFQTDQNYDMQNSTRYSFGVELLPNRNIENYLQRMGFAIGGYYQEANITVKNQPIDNYGFTLGIRVPTSNRTIFNIAYQYASRAGNSTGLIRENYNGITINLSMFDFWFTQRKFE